MRNQDDFAKKHHKNGHTGLHGHGHGHHGHGYTGSREDLAGKLEYCARGLAQFVGRHHGQRKILRILRDQSPISQKELQDILGIQSGSMSEIAAKLEGRGLIVRGRDQTDKRKITLSITEAGQEWMARRDDGEIEQRRTEFFLGLTQEERDTLESLLDKLADNWDQKLEPELQVNIKSERDNTVLSRRYKNERD